MWALVVVPSRHQAINWANVDLGPVTNKTITCLLVNMTSRGALLAKVILNLIVYRETPAIYASRTNLHSVGNSSRQQSNIVFGVGNWIHNAR